MKKRAEIIRYLFIQQPLAYNMTYQLWASEGSFIPLGTRSPEYRKALADTTSDASIKPIKSVIDADEFGEAEETGGL